MNAAMNCQFCCPPKSLDPNAKRSFADQLDHIRKEHLGYKPYKCEKCNGSWTTEWSFREHIPDQRANRPVQQTMIRSNYLSVLGNVMMKCNMNKSINQRTIKQLTEFIKQPQPVPISRQTVSHPVQPIQRFVKSKRIIHPPPAQQFPGYSGKNPPKAFAVPRIIKKRKIMHASGQAVSNASKNCEPLNLSLCELCGFALWSDQGLRMHVSAVHKGARVCSLCSHVSKNFIQFSIHCIQCPQFRPCIL